MTRERLLRLTIGLQLAVIVGLLAMIASDRLRLAAVDCKMRSILAERDALAARQRQSEQERKERAADLQKINAELVRAAWDGKIDQVKSLLSLGADINATAEIKEVDLSATPLIAAVWHGHGEHKQVARLLVERGADVNARPNPEIDHGSVQGRTALMYAALNGDEDTVRLLLKAGADIRATSKDGDTAIDDAIRSHVLPVVLLLHQAGVRVHKPNETIWYEIQFCADEPVKPDRNSRPYDSSSIVDYLLDNGADPNSTYPWSIPTFTFRNSKIAPREDRPSDRDSKVTLLMDACGDEVRNGIHSNGGSVRAVKLLLAHGANPDLKDADGKTALWYAERELSGVDKEAKRIAAEGKNSEAWKQEAAEYREFQTNRWTRIIALLKAARSARAHHRHHRYRDHQE